MMRLVDYIGTSLALLFAAGKLMACPAPATTDLLCVEPLDVVEQGNDFNIVPRQTLGRAQPAVMQAPHAMPIGRGVWIDTSIHPLSRIPQPTTAHPETAR